MTEYHHSIALYIKHSKLSILYENFWLFFMSFMQYCLRCTFVRRLKTKLNKMLHFSSFFTTAFNRTVILSQSAFLARESPGHSKRHQQGGRWAKASILGILTPLRVQSLGRRRRTFARRSDIGLLFAMTCSVRGFFITMTALLGPAIKSLFFLCKNDTEPWCDPQRI